MCEHRAPGGVCDNSIFEAAKDGLYPCLLHHLKMGADVNKTDDEGMSVLMYAVFHEKVMPGGTHPTGMLS